MTKEWAAAALHGSMNDLKFSFLTIVEALQ